MNNEQSKKKLGIIIGSGSLPTNIIKSCTKLDYEPYIVAIDNEATKESFPLHLNHVFIPVTKMGAGIDFFKKHHVKNIIMAGKVNKPDITSVNIDFTTMRLIIKILALPHRGDSEIYSAIIKFLEDRHFTILGIDDILPNIVTKEGIIGEIEPSKADWYDIKIGLNAAKVNGELDVGQAVIVEQGTILSIEGQEGTDNMIKRSKQLKNNSKQYGALIKVKKPNQDHRIDLPAIGTNTIQNLYDSGFKGVAVEAGASILVDPEATIDLANKLGIFIIGIK